MRVSWRQTGDREQKVLKDKQDGYSTSISNGIYRKASYVVESGQMEETQKLSPTPAGSLQRKIQSHGKTGVAANLIQTLRVLARSRRRFTEEQKTKVFRSIIKEAQLKADGVELDVRSTNAKCLVEISAEEGVRCGPRQDSSGRKTRSDRRMDYRVRSRRE
jgi:hypothetical protein